MKVVFVGRFLARYPKARYLVVHSTSMFTLKEMLLFYYMAAIATNSPSALIP